MAGTGISIDVSEIKTLNDRMKRFARNTSKQEQLKFIGKEVKDQTRDRLMLDKKAPDDKPWAALSEPYATRKKKKSSGGILDFTGDLIDSITFQPLEDAVLVGSNLQYARAQQMGFDERNLPARPFLGLSDANKSELEQEIADWLAESWKAA